MKFLSALLLLSAGYTRAGESVTLPIHLFKSDTYNPGIDISSGQRSSQIPMHEGVESNNPRKAKFHPYSLPIDHNPESWQYMTHIQIGTPPQAFRTIIDLAWSSLFVPSVNCVGEICQPLQKYNSTNSKTYSSSYVPTYTRYTPFPIGAYGIQSFDTLTIPSSNTSTGEALTVRNQSFTELKVYEDIFPYDDLQFFDNVLGLSFGNSMEKEFRRGAPGPDPDDVPDDLISPFRTLVESNALDANKFTLQLPLDESSPGSLIFGSSSLEIDSDTTNHPLFPENTDSWTIEASSLQLTTHFEDNTPYTLLNVSLSNYTTLLMTTVPLIYFPGKTYRSIMTELPIQRSDHCYYLEHIPCDKVSRIPTLTLNLMGREIVLNGEDYVEKVEFECANGEKQELCMPMIGMLPELEGQRNQRLMVGSTLLKRFQVGFNWDKRSVSFGDRKYC